MKNILNVFGLLFIVLIIVDSISTVDDGPNDYDMVVLRQFWPATSCMFSGDNKCVIPTKVKNWGIHGLWYFI